MSGYIGTQPVPQATQTRDSFTATSGQTSFATGGYTPNFLDVYLNGVKLASADYTATNGSDVVLASGAATGDILEVVAFTTFNSASSSIDDNGNATAITIDSNENVMVGNTDPTPYTRTSGNAVAMGDGLISSAQSGGNAAIFNRMTNDGSIVGFRKDGSPVGSIGSNASAHLTMGSGDTGLLFNAATDKIHPWNMSTQGIRDNAVDLGVSVSRFKDLYLSGGVYLGGTGSANLLDSYEEGTWNPVFSDQTTGGNTATGSVRGLYTKIGNQVIANCTANNLTTTGMTGSNDLRIQGLPFLPTSLTSPNQFWHGGTRLGSVLFSTSGFVSAYVTDNATYVRLGESISGVTIDNIICSQLTSGSADVEFTITYQTNS